MTPDRGATGQRPLLIGLGLAAVLLVVVPRIGSNDGALLYLLLFAFFPVSGALMVRAYRRRAARMREWAAAIGWTVVGTDRSLTTRWRGQPFVLGTERRVSELVVGPYAGRTCMSFAYAYTTGSGKSRSTSVFHVIAMSLPAYLPTLELTPDGVGAKLAKSFGGQDLAFESADFNAAWRVQAPDRKFAHDVVHPRLMERLLRPDARGLLLRIEGTDILCWSGGPPDLDVIAPRLAFMAAVVSSVPRFVWLDHGYDPART